MKRCKVCIKNEKFILGQQACYDIFCPNFKEVKNKHFETDIEHNVNDTVFFLKEDIIKKCLVKEIRIEEKCISYFLVEKQTNLMVGLYTKEYVFKSVDELKIKIEEIYNEKIKKLNKEKERILSLLEV